MLHPVNFSLKGVVLNEIHGCDEYVIRKLDRFPRDCACERLAAKARKSSSSVKWMVAKQNIQVAKGLGKVMIFKSSMWFISKESKKGFCWWFVSTIFNLYLGRCSSSTDYQNRLNPTTPPTRRGCATLSWPWRFAYSYFTTWQLPQALKWYQQLGSDIVFRLGVIFNDLRSRVGDIKKFPDPGYVRKGEFIIQLS